MEFECQVTTEVSKNLCDSVDNSYRRKIESNQFNSSPESENFGISEQPLDSNTEKEKTSIQKSTPTKKPNSDICGSKQFFSSDVVLHSRRTITDLPPALLSEILNFLDPKELGIVSCVSAYLCKLASEHHVWKDFYCERWGTSTLPTPLGAGVSDETSWKEFFVEREFRSKTFMGRYSIDVMYGHTEAVRTVFLLVSAKLIFTAGYDQTVKMWKMEEGLLIASSRSLGCTMRAVAGDTKLLVAGGTDGFIQCWRAVEGFPHLFDIKGSQNQNTEFRLWDHEGPITSLALDLTRIYSGSWDMTVRVWDRFSLKCVKVLRHSDWVWELVPRDLTVASASGSDVYIWDTSSGGLMTIIHKAHVGNTYSLARNLTGDFLFTGGDDGAIHMYEITSHDLETNPVPVATWVPHSGRVYSLAFEFPWLVSASADGKLSLIDVRKLLRTKKRASDKSFSCVKHVVPSTVEPPQRMLHGFGKNLMSVDIGADRIVCGGEEGIVRIWNFTEALEIERRVCASRAIRLENRMRRRKLHLENISKTSRNDQCLVAAKKNQVTGDRSGWHSKRALSGKLKS
ncbi:F-box/WD-40 repeat-containing protein At5g21040 [Malus sylvestris]|uniref:F-box/WD-40 repeat-containing protein At5g21040 n=1 Tax=Malus sylvestris TaxID=3752 RepID=UPI0021AD08E2|nr:F-box/WD-40 repeat-containing protein At5g21040 [Malus sylvestris]